jgi:hypothetical protein
MLESEHQSRAFGCKDRQTASSVLDPVEIGAALIKHQIGKGLREISKVMPV